MLQKQTIIFIVFMLGLTILPACGSQEAVTPPAPTQPPVEEIPTIEPPTATSPAVTATSTNPLPTPEPISATTTPTEIAVTADDQPTDTPAPEATATELPTATAEVIACDGTLTPAQTEGPYYTRNTPQRASLIEPDMEGTPLLVTGRVLTQDCEPIAGVKLDFWQTDDQGQYDNAGYRLRGHQFTDENGTYTLETILPGQYPGRTAHIHVKVFAPNGQEWLTSQIYLPGISDQTPDGIYRADLLAQNLDPAEDGQRRIGFNFVLPN